MERVRFRDWLFDCDPPATRLAYEAVVGGAERCPEPVCQNFAAARDRVYPAEALDLFDRVGIDHRKEAETYHVRRVGPKGLRFAREQGRPWPDEVLGMHLHGGWFHFNGSILKGPDAYESTSGPPAPFTPFVGRIVLDKESHKAIPGRSEHWVLRMQPLTDKFSLGFTTHAAQVPDSFRGRGVVQVEFMAFVPWVLTEPDPSKLDE